MIARSAQFKRRWVSLGSIGALALGFTLGTLGHESGTTYALDAAALLKPLGSVWLNALRMVVVPLVVAQLVFTLALAGNASGVGRIASASFLVFAALLIIGGAVTITVVPIVLEQIEFAPDAIAALRSASVSLTPPPAAAARTGADLLTGLVPPNVFRAASQMSPPPASTLIGPRPFGSNSIRASTVALAVSMRATPRPWTSGTQTSSKAWRE